MNKVILLGRLTRDVEMRYTPNGKAVTTFTLACNRTHGEKNEADFIRCVAWEKTAESLSKYCGKGRQIYLEGRLRNRSYEKDGQKRYITEVIVSHVEFCGSKNDNAKTADEPPEGDFGGEYTEIPF